MEEWRVGVGISEIKEEEGRGGEETRELLSKSIGKANRG